MVYAMVCYNIALDRGALSNFVFRAALSELPLMCLIAFVLEFFLIGRAASLLFHFSSWREAFARWVQIWFCNFPMALLYQLFFAGPLVRFIFRLLFKKQLARQNQKAE